MVIMMMTMTGSWGHEVRSCLLTLGMACLQLISKHGIDSLQVKDKRANQLLGVRSQMLKVLAGATAQGLQESKRESSLTVLHNEVL